MNLEARFRDTVTVADKTVDGFQKVTLGTRTVLKARVQRKLTHVIRAPGDELFSKHTVYTAQQILDSQVMWLSEDDNTNDNKAHTILDTMASPSVDGATTLYKTLI